MKKLNFTVYLIKGSFREKDSFIKNNAHHEQISNNLDFYYKNSDNKPPKWRVFFETSLSTDTKNNLFTSHASAVLIVKTQNRYFAVTYWPAWRYLIEEEAIEEKFWIKIVLNSIDSTSIRSMDIKDLEKESKQTREQTSKASPVEYFWLDIQKDIVNAVTWSTKIEYQEIFGKVISGKDMVRISSDKPITEVKELCRKLLEQYNKEDYKENFDRINNISSVRDKTTIRKLEEKLLEDINNLRRWDDDIIMILSMPEIIDRNDFWWVKYWNLRNAIRYDELDINNFIENREQDITENDITQKIHILDANGDQKNQWRINKCIYYECDLAWIEWKFILSSWNWYKIETSYVARINQKFIDIPRLEWIDFIDYTGWTELEYNRQLATSINWICLDQVLYIIHWTRSKIEYCDVFKDNRLIHIKKYNGSSSLSHLFEQGYVSAELLLWEPDYKEKLWAELDRNSHPHTLDNIEVIFGYIKNWEDLPFFSKVVACKTIDKLKSMRINWYIKQINKQT